MTDLQVSRVDPDQAAGVLTQVGPQLARAMRGYMDEDGVLDQLAATLATGRQLLWAVHDGAEIIAVIVIEVIDDPARRVLRVVGAAGSRFHDWIDQVEVLLQDYKQLVGAAAVEAEVRDGLTRWLGNRGWRRTATIMEFSEGVENGQG